MSEQLVYWELESDIAVVIIDNPPMNVLSMKVIGQLDDCFREINNNTDCRAVVVTGAGEKAFMAGADIKDLAEIISNSTSSLLYTKKIHDSFNRLENLPIPTLAAINGYALGGGLELALACDIRLASEKAQLGLPEIKLGLFPGGGGTQRLPRLIGTSLAKEMLFLGEPLTASASLAIGLVNRIFPHNELLPAAKELAHRIASRPGIAVKLLKETVNRGICSTLEEGLTVERDLLDRAFKTEDAQEGVQSFLKKKKAHFKNR